MELIGLRILLTFICFSAYLTNIRVTPKGKFQGLLYIGTSLILGASFAGVWLWF